MAVHRLDLIERTETLTAQVAEKLREALTGGVFAPGDKITIRAVAKSLGVSLTPAREALSILAAEGALEFGANRTLMVPPLSIDRLAEITRIRIALEGLAAERAARLLEDREIARIVAANEAMIRATEAEDFKGAIRHNHEFHFGIYRGSRMPTLIKMIEGLWLRTGAYVNLIYPAFGLARKGIENHERAARALKVRDAEGLRAAIEFDIRYSAEHLETELRAKQPEALKLA